MKNVNSFSTTKRGFSLAINYTICFLGKGEIVSVKTMVILTLISAMPDFHTES